jgi:hypothetical protein
MFFSGPIELIRQCKKSKSEVSHNYFQVLLTIRLSTVGSTMRLLSILSFTLGFLSFLAFLMSPCPAFVVGRGHRSSYCSSLFALSFDDSMAKAKAVLGADYNVSESLVFRVAYSLSESESEKKLALSESESEKKLALSESEKKLAVAVLEKEMEKQFQKAYYLKLLSSVQQR